MAADPSQRITLARLLRPHGLRGEIAAEILTDFPERLTRLKTVFLWDGHGELRQISLVSCWISHSRGGQAIFHFSGVNSIEDAERFRGLQVQVPMADRVELPLGQYYFSDLIGCAIWEVGASAPLGLVRDVTRATGTPLLEVDVDGKELLIPLATEICTRIDVDARKIEVSLPEGLRDLNR
ncbi:MAG TPA: ribosome maturation factor RimM [Candidatus Acidoferrales bacterium]|nr:ribosome maturation factor RimM [Candidatus Acidoferrales bacterium]